MKTVELYLAKYQSRFFSELDIVVSKDAVWSICFQDELTDFYKKLKKHKVNFEIKNQKTTLHTQVVKQLREYEQQKRTEFNLPIKFVGTDFQIKVWKQLLKIKFGETLSYKDLATQLKMQSGFQSIGQANKNNPICVVVPCHRVIAASGALSGYVGGAHIKQNLLHHEGAKINF